MKQGIKFKSQTDTEVIAQLIGTYLDKGDDIGAAGQQFALLSNSC